MKKSFFVAMLICTMVSVLTFNVSAEEKDETSEKIVYYWQFEDNGWDLSHKEFHFDVEEMDPLYDEGVIGKGVDLADCILLTKSFSNEYDWSSFSCSFWFNWYGGAAFNVPFALGAKGTTTHLEINIESTGEEGPLGFYNEGSVYGQGGTVEAGKWYCVTVVSKPDSFTIYLNGEAVITRTEGVSLAGIGDSEGNYLSLGGQQDYAMPAYGIYDEVVLANYAFDDELVNLLYSNPQSAHDQLVNTVQANYPEDYVRPADPTATPLPTKKPTVEPTQTPESTATQTIAPTADVSATKDVSSDNTDKDGNAMTIIIPVIIGVVVVAAVVVAVIAIKRKKK